MNRQQIFSIIALALALVLVPVAAQAQESEHGLSGQWLLLFAWTEDGESVLDDDHVIRQFDDDGVVTTYSFDKGTDTYPQIPYERAPDETFLVEYEYYPDDEVIYLPLPGDPSKVYRDMRSLRFYGPDYFIMSRSWAGWVEFELHYSRIPDNEWYEPPTPESE